MRLNKIPDPGEMNVLMVFLFLWGERWGVKNSQHRALFFGKGGLELKWWGVWLRKNEEARPGAGVGGRNKFPIPATNVLLIPVNIVTTPFCGGFLGGKEKRRIDGSRNPPFFLNRSSEPVKGCGREGSDSQGLQRKSVM